MPNFLNALLGQRSKLEALRCLSAEKDELSGREIARRTGRSHLAIHKALHDLVEEGVVARRSVPPTHLFKLNREHWLASEILSPMFAKEASWLERLESLLRQGVPKTVTSLVLFGSVVKGKLTPKSDVDVLALVSSADDAPAVESHFHQVGEKLYSGFGRPLSLVVMPAAEFSARHRKEDSFARDIAYSGRVIHGKLLTEVLFEHGAKKH